MSGMKAIQKRIAAILEKLQRNKAGIAWQLSRWRKWDRKADAAHRRAERESTAADQSLAAADRLEDNDPEKVLLTRKADRQNRRAERHQRRADKFRSLAQDRTGRIKILKRHNLKLDKLAREAMTDLEAEKAKHHVTVHVNQNKVTGGSEKSRFRTAALVSSNRCLSGKRGNYYSMYFPNWTVDKLFTGENYGSDRSDCSQWATSVCKAAGLPDPNGTDFTGGYTGTMVGEHNGWHFVSEAEMRKRGWGFVIYGTGTGHHVEAYVGNGSDLTIGHGSSPIDPGVINLFGDSNYRCLVLN